MAARAYLDDVLKTGRQREYAIADLGTGFSNITENQDALEVVGSTFGEANAMGDMVLECDVAVASNVVTISHPSGEPHQFWFVAPKDYVASDIYMFQSGSNEPIALVLAGIYSGAWKSGTPVTLNRQGNTAYLVNGGFSGYPGPGSHNSIHRGAYLGSSVTATQYAAIAAGTFDDLYIGDYWTISGVNYRIAAFDYYYRCGDNADLQTHHVTLVPDSALYNATMNASNITTGGYVGSLMYTTNLAQAKTTINAAFSGHVLTHRQYLTNAVTSGKASGGAWFDSSIELMNEIMVYGGGVFSPVSDGTNVPSHYTLGKTQLPLFRLRPDLISNRIGYWLRDVVSVATFANVDYTGLASYGNASNSRGVRPAFSIS